MTLTLTLDGEVLEHERRQWQAKEKDLKRDLEMAQEAAYLNPNYNPNYKPNPNPDGRLENMPSTKEGVSRVS